jgi:choline dehydrogenase-like flavoprotein
LFIDAKELPPDTNLEGDVCIVGGGAAGISIAREFLSTRHRIILLESGDILFNEETQNLYQGQDIGRKYWDPKDIRFRLRFFGGTTNHWGGWCAMPGPLDFETRPDIKHSGWPFPLANLEPWYNRAKQVCRIGPYGFALSDWGVDPASIPPPFNGPHFNFEIVRVSRPIVHFSPAYGPSLELAQNIRIFLNANGLYFETESDHNEVKALRVATLSGKRFSVKAKLYILASGAIENVRLLLLSRSKAQRGFGNDFDVVGRFLMAHLAYTGGIVAFTSPSTDPAMFYGRQISMRDGRQVRYVRALGLTEKTRRKHALPNMRLVFGPINAKRISKVKRRNDLDQVQDLYDIENFNSRTTTKESGEVGGLLAMVNSEQLPNPESRVSLGEVKDALGMQTVSINWQLLREDKRGMAEGHRLLGIELGRSNLGRYQTFVPLDESDTWPDDMIANGHCMGTTRMHANERLGVVDESCRVHGMKNLYIAGSSVFPTGGTFNPTFTIVALALRLADRIKSELT